MISLLMTKTSQSVKNQGKRAAKCKIGTVLALILFDLINHMSPFVIKFRS